MPKSKGELVVLLIGLTFLAALLTQIWTYVIGGLALFGAAYLLQRWPPSGPPNMKG